MSRPANNGIGALERQKLLDAAAEMARRKMEGLRLYRPLPYQLQFHLSKAPERIIRGGNRSGKTLAAFAEFASAATGQPVFGPDDKPLPHQYKTTEPLMMWLIGWDERHIGETIFRVLFQPGAFRIIRDNETGEWRAWRPWEQSDRMREKHTRPSPPLIPPRMIDPAGWGWVKRNEHVFATCRLRNGTEIRAYSSGSRPKQGDPCDVILIDEDVRFPEHVQEWEARLSDRRGRLIWAAMPHDDNDALVSLSTLAIDQANEPEPTVAEFVTDFRDNPYIPAEEKKKRLSTWDDDTVRKRVLGEFAHSSILVFPNFSRDTHGITLEAADQRWPDRTNWCRYMVVDPGHTVCAVSFWAIPPPKDKDKELCLLEDELYLVNCDPALFGSSVKDKIGKQSYYAFIIDDHGSRSDVGTGYTIRQLYTEALRANAIESMATGFGFIPGSDRVQARVQQFRNWLRVEGGDTEPRFKLILDNTPSFQREIKRYRKKQVTMATTGGRQIVDEPDDRRYSHLMVTAQYLAAYDPKYHKPVQKRKKSWAEELMDKKRAKRRQKNGPGFVNLGPQSTADLHMWT